MTLFIFVGVLIVVSQQNERVRATEQATLELQTCNGLAQTVERVAGVGPASEARVEIALDANIQNGFILVGKTFCVVHADANNAVLNAGTVRVAISTGNVEVSNA